MSADGIPDMIQPRDPSQPLAIHAAEPEAPAPAPAAPDMGALMRVAIERGSDGVAALERLVALQERAEAQQAQRDFAQAMTNFQARLRVVGYNATGAHNARYATLDHIMAEIGPLLTACGLSVTWDSTDEDARLRVTCRVHHVGGFSRESSFAVPRETAGKRMNVSQAEGSAMSYGRRYSLCLALGISTGERDDDGAAAGAEPQITEQQAADLRALAEGAGADIDAFLRWAGADTFAGIRASRYGHAVAMLEAKRARASQ